MEEVGGSDTNRMAGPREQVLVSCGDVEYLVRNVAQENCDLQGRDGAARASVGIAVHCSGAGMGRTKSLCSSNDVQACLRGAQPV